MGWQSWWCLTQWYDGKEGSQNTWDGSCKREEMHEWPQNEGVGICEFCGHGNATRSEWKFYWDCFLVAKHINLAELNATIKSINLALQWQVSQLHLIANSACVNHWISNTITGKACINTKLSDKMLVRWQLETLQGQIDKYDGRPILVKSNQNWADHLTRVLQVVKTTQETEPVQLVSTTIKTKLDTSLVTNIHR